MFNKTDNEYACSHKCISRRITNNFKVWFTSYKSSEHINFQKRCEWAISYSLNTNFNQVPHNESVVMPSSLEINEHCGNIKACTNGYFNFYCWNRSKQNITMYNLIYFYKLIYFEAQSTSVFSISDCTSEFFFFKYWYPNSSFMDSDSFNLRWVPGKYRIRWRLPRNARTSNFSEL